MERLRKRLDALVEELDDAESLKEKLEELVSVYPFNEFEYVISTLLGRGKLSIDDYYEIRDDYIDRNTFLYVFEITAPRGFGEAWAHGHLKELVPELERPSKNKDPNYSGDYDFYLDGSIRVEVKASRAVAFQTDEPLYVKALSSDSESQFDMNFQQVKPRCCDVMVWIAVWRDIIRYWVLNSEEVEANGYFSAGQHRGNVGEGQLHLNKDNIDEFARYECRPHELLRCIRGAFDRLPTGRG